MFPMQITLTFNTLDELTKFQASVDTFAATHREAAPEKPTYTEAEPEKPTTGKPEAPAAQDPAALRATIKTKILEIAKTSREAAVKCISDAQAGAAKLPDVKDENLAKVLANADKILAAA